MTTAIEGLATCLRCRREARVIWPNDDPDPYVAAHATSGYACPHCGGGLQDPEQWEPVD